MNVAAHQEEKNVKASKREAGKEKTVDRFQRRCMLPFEISQLFSLSSLSHFLAVLLCSLVSVPEVQEQNFLFIAKILYKVCIAIQSFLLSQCQIIC